MQTRILVVDKFEQIGLEGLAPIASVTYLPQAGATGTMAAAVTEHDPHVLIVRGSKTPKAAIDAGKSLKGIIRAGAGYDNIDLAAASARGAAVCNCPGMNA